MPLSAVTAGELPESLSIKQNARVLWDFEDGLQGWTSKNNVSPYTASAGCLRGTVSGTDPHIFDPNLNQISEAGTAGVAVRIWMSATAPLELFWANEDGNFAQSRRVATTVPGQQWTTVHFNLSTHAQWLNKTISRVRLDPGSTGVSFIIDYVALVDNLTVPSDPFVTETFNFQSSMQGWTITNQVSNYRLEDGKLKGKSNGNDPSVTSPVLSAANQGGVVIELKTDQTASFKLYWSTTEGSFAEFRSISSALIATTAWQTLKFDLRDHPQWAGKTITGLRIDPSTASGQNFEIDSVTLLGIAGVEDADGDLIDGLDELIYGTDPTVRNSLPRKITQEKWSNITNYSTNELYMNPAYYGEPTLRQHGTLESNSIFDTNHYATRYRGYLTAPTTGTYRFWVTGRSGAELSLSPSDSKYHKQRIAQLNPDAGTGYGVFSNSDNLWDVYTSQMSEEIHLVAGQTYYLEAIQTTGHVGSTHLAIAWAKPGQAREVLTTDYLESYYPTIDDADDDYLPDAWEIQYGLDPTDNGLIDLARQGERGDYDGDGLSNRMEYLYGTDPTNPDTDGDGLVDSAEVNSYGTDPTVSDAPSGLVTSTLDLTTYTTTGSPWTLTTPGLIPSSFRGSINWNFSVSSNGFWLLDVATILLGDLYLHETVDIEVLINGVSMGDKTLIYGSNREALLRVFTPYLTAGNHTIGLKINNNVTRRMVGIHSIKVIEPQGADLNSDGIPDWVAAQIMGENALRPYSVTSRTSPANLEGSARMRSLTTLNSNPVTAGLDQTHWYTDLPLNASTATSFSVLLEQGFEETGAISWDSTNVFSSETLTIRKGDSLKLIGQALTGPTGQAVTLTFGPAGWNGTVGATGTYQVQLATDSDHHIYSLTAPGTYKVRATLADSSTALMSIVVRRADFPATPKDLLANKFGSLSFSTSVVSSGAYFDGGQTVFITNPATLSGSTITLQAAPNLKSGSTNLLARLREEGPVIGRQSLNLINLSDVLQNDTSFAYTSADYLGYRIIRSPIVATDLPEGATLVITIFRAGVTFLDGTKTLTLSASDFVNGVYNLEFLFPENLTGGYCHYIDIYDRNGVYLGRR